VVSIGTRLLAGDPRNLGSIPSRDKRFTRAVHEETELFFLNLLLYLNLIKLVAFKVLPSTLDTPLPTFFPVLERVLERVLRDGAKVPYLFSKTSRPHVGDPGLSSRAPEAENTFSLMRHLRASGVTPPTLMHHAMPCPEKCRGRQIH
jgi:hypothetical protein